VPEASGEAGAGGVLDKHWHVVPDWPGHLGMGGADGLGHGFIAHLGDLFGQSGPHSGQSLGFALLHPTMVPLGASAANYPLGGRLPRLSPESVCRQPPPSGFLGPVRLGGPA
jgi:hypothetical protein